MKCRYIKDKPEPRAEFFGAEGTIERNGKWFWPAGTIENHPRAYLLVKMGEAEAADDECRERVGMSQAQMAYAQKCAEARNKGIEPQDYQRYWDGELAGYDIDGNDIPGPNFIEDDDDDGE